MSFPIKHTQSVHITEVPGACPSSIVEFSTLSQYVSLSFQPKLLEGWVGVLVGSYYQPGNVSQGKRNKEASLCHTILVKRDDYYFRTNISKIYTPCSCYTVQTVINGPPDPSHDNSLLISFFMSAVFKSVLYFIISWPGYNEKECFKNSQNIYYETIWSYFAF